MQINPNSPDFNIHDLSGQNVDKTHGNQDDTEPTLGEQFNKICTDANNLINSIDQTFQFAAFAYEAGNPEQAKKDIANALPGWENSITSLQDELDVFSKEAGNSSSFANGINDIQSGIDDLKNMYNDISNGNYDQGRSDFHSAVGAIQAAFSSNP